jgi:PadR family transcriptional regulator PadR
MTKTLGEFEILLLMALLRLDESAYGAEVHREIQNRTGRSVVVGAVYTGLARLEQSGLISSRVGEPTPERGGRRKRYYRVEAAGLRALRKAIGGLREMAAGIQREVAWVEPAGEEGGGS